MNYQTLERTIGHSFADIVLLDLAMTHPSYALQHKCQDNQRLEFLGDAVLEICVSRVLYHKYPKLREGQLTRKRAALVCEANLARAAMRLGLGSYLKLDRGEEVVGGRENPSILADTMEAVIAAVYLDAGMEEAAKLVDLAMDGYETSEKNDRDAKSALQEYLQALGEETPSLSGGEAQRLKLAGEMGKGQSDTVFIFDEPTIGLHPLDVRTLLKVFQTLIESGTTVIVIEHDLDVIRSADYIIDMGPGGGEAGGIIVATGTPEQVGANKNSITGKYLCK